MKPPTRRLLAPVLLGLFACPGWPQNDQRQEAPVRLPSGKMQQEEILKAEHENNLKDAAKLVEMAGQLKAGLEKNDRHVLSMSTLKQTEEIEKLARRIRSRLRRR